MADEKHPAAGQLRVWWDTNCGLCDEYSQMFGPNPYQGGMSRELREAGWRRTRRDGWICPNCAESQS